MPDIIQITVTFPDLIVASVTSNVGPRGAAGTNGVDGADGSGAAQLPAWTYTAGAIGSGLVITNNAVIAATTQITLSQTVAGNYFTGWDVLSPGTILHFTDSAGLVSKFVFGGSGEDSGNIQLNVAFASSGSTNWSGKYTIAFSPAQQTKTDVGLGNVDNTSDVNKPVSTAQQTALDLKADKSALGTAAAAATGDFATAAQGATADTAETHAQTALTNANTAQSTADTAETHAQTALSNAATAQAAAATAQAAANTAQSTADTAETHAQTGITNAATNATAIAAILVRLDAYDVYISGHP